MDLRRLLGYSKITFHFHEDPLPLRDRDGDETDFLSICRSITPACWLNPLLFNGHLQTTWTVVKGRDPLVYYKRKIFEAENPAFAGTFAVDFVVQPHADTDNTLPPRTVNFSDGELEMIGSKDEKPMLLTLHGLTGGSQEAYLKHVPESLFKEGWEACVVNARGCAQSKITTGFLFNARATWDVRQVVKWLRDKFPNRPLFAIGYSLGANILANYLGEEGDKCLLDAAVVCSNPWNLDVGSIALQRTWAGLEGYSRSMARDLKGLFELNIEQLSENPRINVEKIRNVQYLHEFDSCKGQHGAIPPREHIVRPTALQAKAYRDRAY
ncbi:MAG: hypothetical protein L6R41_006255 [Letrouitia leprolyta]|nr:MAG: hypothetical protein L6R41_006255 [Letrouitia leprolyta]